MYIYIDNYLFMRNSIIIIKINILKSKAIIFYFKNIKSYYYYLVFY